MISNLVLRYLISNKIKDAKILIKYGRCPASMYIAGYAIELALKYKICRTLQFNQGFPENRQELSNYLTIINRNNPQPIAIDIRDIRNHDLNTLLFYSGVELRIKGQFFAEWSIVSRWSPENRYKKTRVLNKTAAEYPKAAAKIIREID